MTYGELGDILLVVALVGVLACFAYVICLLINKRKK